MLSELAYRRTGCVTMINLRSIFLFFKLTLTPDTSCSSLLLGLLRWIAAWVINWFSISHWGFWLQIRYQIWATVLIFKILRPEYLVVHIIIFYAIWIWLLILFKYILAACRCQVFKFDNTVPINQILLRTIAAALLEFWIYK